MVSDDLDRPEPLQSIADAHQINLSAMPRVEGALAAAIEAGRAMERGAIVDWLSDPIGAPERATHSWLAFAIDEGKHLNYEKGTEA